MRTSSLGYLIKEGAKNVFHNRLMSFASIGVLTACLILIGGATLLTMNINAVVGYVEDQNEVMAFLEDSVAEDEDQVAAMQAAIEDLDGVGEVTYVSREEVLEEQMAADEELADLLSGLEADNPFPATFRIRVDDLDLIEEIIQQVESMEGVEDINAALDLAATVLDIKSIVSFSGTFIVVILGVVALVIVGNTIKITVFNRRKEISIMKYVGATNTFIRLPFVVEGILLGLFSAVIAFLLLWGGYTYVMQWVSEAPSSWLQMVYNSFVPFEQVAPLLLGGFAAAGVGIGVLGSMCFIGKFMKV